MSIYFLVCRRSPQPPLSRAVLDELHRYLAPPEVRPVASVIHCDSPFVAELFPHGYSTVGRDYLSVGALDRVVPSDCQADLPDHVQFMWRWSDQEIRVKNDVAGTRRLWYYSDDEFFIVSTSQRVIVALVGSVIPHEPSQQWMLGSGCLAPFESWDSRIHSLRPNSVLTFDRSGWRASLSHEEIGRAHV